MPPHPAHRKLLPRTAAGIVVASLLLALANMAAELPAIRSERKNGEVVLFDAQVHDCSAFKHYTASWHKGSDLTPICTVVNLEGRRMMEISYRGQQGMACSTLYPAPLPKPEPGQRYAGIGLTIEYAKDDFAKLGVTIGYDDKSLLSATLTLERGLGSYEVTSGFRREKAAPDWSRIAYIMLNVQAADPEEGRDGRSLRFRLQKIAMIEKAQPASVERPNEQSQFGQRLFSPQPKQVQWKDGQLALRGLQKLFVPEDASARTHRTATLFAEKLYGFTGQQWVIQSFHGAPPAVGIVLQVAPSATFNAMPVSLTNEGYCLAVNPKGAVIAGGGEPGLFYGTVTFLQLLQQPMKITANRPVPCVEILDWPDLTNRLCRLEHGHHFKDSKVNENRGIAYLMDWTDRFVAGNKLNVLMVDLSAVVKYQRRPEFNGRERLYSLDDLKQFGEFCRDRFIEVCPAWQIGGHETWWMLVGYHPELREKGWNSQGDVTHPDHEPIMLNCMQDVIDALKPKYLSPKSDEWWHDRRSGETPDPLLRGKPRAEAFLDLHVQLHDWLRRQGITMLIYHDMLTPYHNGTRFDTYQVIDRFPKDTILLVWSDHHPKMIRYFTERGFRVWANPTGTFFPNGEDRSRITGYGKGLYSWGQSRELLDEHSSLTSLDDLCVASDFAWNLNRDPGEAAAPRIQSERMVALRQMFAVSANPAAGERVDPLDIAAVMNQSLATYLKQVKPEAYPAGRATLELKPGVQDIGFLPIRLLGGPEKNCLVLREGDPVITLPIQGRYSSLIFLHTAFIDQPDDRRASGAAHRAWLYGWPLGDYVVQYQDGQTTVLPLRLGMNLKRLDGSPLNRATLENRCVHALKDSNGKDVHLFQWEWVNPRPDAEIAQVDVRHANSMGATLILMAVSGRTLGPVSEPPVRP